jgi:hypothetical protein
VRERRKGGPLPWETLWAQAPGELEEGSCGGSKERPGQEPRKTVVLASSFSNEEESQADYSQGISQSLGWDFVADPPAEIWPFLSDYARRQEHNFARWRFWFDRHIIRAYVLGRMAEQNGVRDAAEGGNDENGHHAGPSHHPPRVLRHHPDLDRPPTPANGLNLEEGGRPRGFNNQNVRHPPPARSGYAFQARRREVNENPGTLRLEESARAEEEEEFPVLQENAQNVLPNPLREGLDAPRDQVVPENPEVFINQRTVEAARVFRPRASDLPAPTEPLNFLPQETPALRNHPGNPSLNTPPVNRQGRAHGEGENQERNVPRVFVQRRNRPVRVLPHVRPVEAYVADDENDSPPPQPAVHPNPSPQPQLTVFSDRQSQFHAYSAARPDVLPQRVRAQKRTASVEVDNPRAHAEEVPPMAAPASGPHMSLPKLQLPAFKGEKGAKAQIWLESLGRFQKFYRMTDEQAVELARFSCKGPYAKAWAGLLPDDLTLATFKEHFKAEFAVENQDKLMSELLEKVQKEGVGEYATKTDGVF